jgi:hypothetical protein
MVSLIAVLAVANSLRSDDGENVEYDKALVDLTTSLMPGDADVARELVEYIVLETRPPYYDPSADTAPRATIPEPIPMTRHAARTASA